MSRVERSRATASLMTCSNTERLQNRSLRFFRAAIIHVEGLGLSIHARSMRARDLFPGSTVETDMINSQQGRFVWYELMTTDMEAAKTFYADVVGWGTKDASIPGMAYTLFTAGEASVSGLMDLPEDARRMGARSRTGSDMSARTTWMLPPPELDTLAAPCMSHRRTSPASAAFR